METIGKILTLYIPIKARNRRLIGKGLQAGRGIWVLRICFAKVGPGFYRAIGFIRFRRNLESGMGTFCSEKRLAWLVFEASIAKLLNYRVSALS